MSLCGVPPSLAGGVLVRTSSTRPTGTDRYEGILIYETDTDRYMSWNGSAWIVISGRVGCSIRRAANQSIANNSVTAMSFDTETTDSDGFFAPTSIVATIPAGLGGIYIVTGGATWASGPSASSWTSIAKNGARLGAVSNAGDTLNSVTTAIPLVAGDQVAYHLYQLSGAAVNVTGFLDFYMVSV